MMKKLMTSLTFACSLLFFPLSLSLCLYSNVVPVWFASPKREVGGKRTINHSNDDTILYRTNHIHNFLLFLARTLRPKINKLLPDFLTHFPTFKGNQHIPQKEPVQPISWDECEKHLDLDSTVKEVEWAKAGKENAMKRFQEFTTSPTEGLKNFDSLRNDPNYRKVCSNLSPWVNYGHVSFQRLALEVRALKKYPNGTASYIEEGIVRRELSDNFVYYSPENYDDLSTGAVWAQESLQLHSSDEREFIYSLEQFTGATTHDDLWNAAQMQLNLEGKMHGFVSIQKICRSYMLLLIVAAFLTDAHTFS